MNIPSIVIPAKAGTYKMGKFKRSACGTDLMGPGFRRDDGKGEAPMAKPILGFPTLWGDELDSLHAEGRSCPVPDERIREYLKGCQYHLCLDEEPSEFSTCRLREYFSFPDRQIWILSSCDGLGREWDILIGCGRSPFHGESGYRVWASAEHYSERVTPVEVLLHQFPEYASSARSVN